MKSTITLLLLSFLVSLTSCQGQDNSGTETAATAFVSKKVSVNEFKTKLSSLPPVQLIDVRTAEEFAEGHLRNAINIDVNASDFSEQVSKLNSTRTTLVYCHSGRRSTAAARELVKNGYVEVYNLMGGITEWKSAGMEVVK